MDWLTTLAKKGFGKQADILRRHAIRHIQMTTSLSAEAKFKLGESKIGGCPHLPADFQWPLHDGKPLAFLAQFELKTIARYDRHHRLPAKGILYFFHAGNDVWGFDPRDRSGFRVIHLPGDPARLNVTPVPPGLKKEGLFFYPCKLKFTQKLSYPTDRAFSTSLFDETSFENDDARREFQEILDEWNDDKPNEPRHMLFGYPDLIQGDSMYLASQLVSNGFYCGHTTEHNDPRAKELEKGAGDWTLLFQIDTDENPGIMWGDCGIIYFNIRKDDLQKRNFDAAWAILQCY